MPRIVLCYASDDREQVETIYDRLHDAGFEPWMDTHDLLPGQVWRQVIPAVLQSSAFILIFLSANSVAKQGYVQREFKLALETLQELPEGTIHTIPVRLDACEIPASFQDLHGANLFEEEGFEHLIRALGGNQTSPIERLRSAVRFVAQPEVRARYGGFRCVRVSPQP